MKLSLLSSSLPLPLLSVLSSLALATVACSSTTSSTPAADGGADATVDGASPEGSITVTCTRTAATACAASSTADCPYPTFAAARAASCCGATGCTVKVTSSPCGGYDVAELQGVDTVTTYYFDHTSGDLVATVHFGATMIGGNECNAGPATFDAPNCTRASFACVPDVADASVDAAADAASD
jgi:hypothetical protein